MKLKDIFFDTITKVFVVTSRYSECKLNWEIEATNLELIPDEENYYIVRALQVSKKDTADCYIGIMIPERFADIVVKRNGSGQIVVDIFEDNQTVISAVASERFGDYGLFYAFENPQIGIDILRSALNKATNKSVVAADLGNILSDEERIEEAIDAFKIIEENGPCHSYDFWRMALLYEKIGQPEKQIEYIQKYKDKSEIEETERKTTGNSTLPKAGRSWWQKLFGSE